MTDQEPRPPEGVVIVYRDGERVPAELYYAGLQVGTHHWVVTTTIDRDRLDHLHADVIPGHTAINFQLKE